MCRFLFCNSLHFLFTPSLTKLIYQADETLGCDHPSLLVTTTFLGEWMVIGGDIMKKWLMSILVTAIILAGCSAKEETIAFEDKQFASTLVIQKVEHNASTEEKTKMVTEEDKIEKTLTQMEGLEVEEISQDSFVKKLKSKSSYTFVFLGPDQKESGKGKYAFAILEDGTILFNFTEVEDPGSTMISKQKQPEVLEELKEKLDVSF